MNELDKARVALYNAAVAHADYITSDKHDFETAMRVSDELERAALNFARWNSVFAGTSGPG